MVDRLIAAIEKQFCIRKIWRCNAGWGMAIIPDPFSEPEQFVVYAYYDSLEECVLAEYRVQVLGLDRPTRGFLEREAGAADE